MPPWPDKRRVAIVATPSKILTHVRSPREAHTRPWTSSILSNGNKRQMSFCPGLSNANLHPTQGDYLSPCKNKVKIAAWPAECIINQDKRRGPIIYLLIYLPPLFCWFPYGDSKLHRFYCISWASLARCPGVGLL